MMSGRARHLQQQALGFSEARQALLLFLGAPLPFTHCRHNVHEFAIVLSRLLILVYLVMAVLSRSQLAAYVQTRGADASFLMPSHTANDRYPSRKQRKVRV